MKDLKNFQNIINEPKSIQIVLDTLHRIKVLTYIMAYFENGCEPVYRLEQSEAKIIELSQELTPQNLISVTEEAYAQCMDIIQERSKSVNPDNIIRRTATDDAGYIDPNYVNWDKICNESMDNVENPQIVDKILLYLFQPEDSVVPKYKAVLWDLCDYPIYFSTEEEAYSFVEAYLDDAEVCELGTNEYC